MVGGSALFTRNLYAHALPNRSHTHYLWVGRASAGGLLALGILLALRAESVTQLVLGSVKVIGLLGAAFWLGVVWRRANAAAVWASFLGSLLMWGLMNAPAAGAIALGGLSEPHQILIMLATQFGLLVLVSLLTPPLDMRTIKSFFARIHTPVGKEDEVRWEDTPHDLPEAATIGLGGVLLDYRKSSRFAYRRLQELGLEIPRLTWFDWGGFRAAWLLVGGLIGLLSWLAGLGSK
jgi:hypothetical protein